MQRVNGHRQYVFASPTHPRQTYPENALLQRMRRLGIIKEMVPLSRDFRASARTLLDEELAYKKDWIEHQLAHKVRELDGRVNRTEFLRERKIMMQAWSDYSLQYVQPSKQIDSNVQLIKEIS